MTTQTLDIISSEARTNIVKELSWRLLNRKRKAILWSESNQWLGKYVGADSYVIAVPTNPCALMGQVLWTNNEVAVEHCLRFFSRRNLGPVSKDAAGFQSCWFQWKSLSMTLSQSSVIVLLVFLQMGLLWIRNSCNVSYQSNFPRRIGKFCELFFQMKMGSMRWCLWEVI